MWASAVFTVAGALLVLGVLAVSLRDALRAASPARWAERYEGETYVHFAWQELGRGLFLGYLFTLGLSPMAAAFFSGGAGFWREFFYLTLINWGLGAIAIYLLQLAPGLLGYLRHRQEEYDRRARGLGISLQLLIVLVMSAPLAYIFVVLLLPPAQEFFRIIVSTAWLFVQMKL